MSITIPRRLVLADAARSNRGKKGNKATGGTRLARFQAIMDTHSGGDSPSRIRILIVDDHPLFREGLERALSLESDIVVVGHGEDGQQAVALAYRLRPHVMLLDVNLPDMNGMQIARQVRHDNPQIAIVILTAYHEAEQVIYALRAGASAYCTKDISPDELVGVVRDVAGGLYVVDGQRMDRQTLKAWLNAEATAISGPHVEPSNRHLMPLSPRETEILRSVTSGLSNKEIAVELGISQQTVKNHMTSILRKLNVDDRTQAAVTAIRHGWVQIKDTKR